jgi:ankyrin repeat protein
LLFKRREYRTFKSCLNYSFSNIIFGRDYSKGDSVMFKKISILSTILFMLSFKLLLTDNLMGQDIHTAVRNGDLAAVKAVLEEDPSQIEALNGSKSSPLIVAASGGYIQMIAFLFEKGADIQAVNKWGMTALHYAVNAGHLEL